MKVANFIILNDTQARLLWHDMEPGVKRAIDGTPGNKIEDIKRYVMTASARVVGIFDDNRIRFGSIIYMPMGPNAFIVSIEGRDIVSKQNSDKFHELMRQQGFKSIQCLAAPAQARLWKRLEYNPVKTLLEKQLWVE